MTYTGTVKWFNSTKGYGFITPNDGGNDLFLHKTALGNSGLDSVEENQKISYDIETGKGGKVSAVNIKLL